MTPAYTLNETLIKVENVSLKLGGNQILKNVNAEIRNIVRPDVANQGQVVGFLGPSGVGKTQLLKILAGLQKKPYDGKVLITERGIPVRAGMVGVVTQNYFLRRNYKVLKNLIVAARRTGAPYDEAKKKAYAMLDRFDLRDRANLYPAQLSGGQRQRIAIAQQLLCSEHFLLMDEPFSGLDPTQKDNACELITEVASANELNTIIIVTHDTRSALAVSDHIWMMGRDRDSSGNIVPGAYLKEVYNLIDMGLAWHKDIKLTKEFSDFVREIEEKFREL